MSFLPAFQNNPIRTTRRGIVHHSFLGFFSYRLGDWKLLLARDGGTKSERELAKNPKLPKAQLYNLASDPAETANLYEANPSKADELLAALKNDIQRGLFGRVKNQPIRFHTGTSPHAGDDTSC